MLARRCYASVSVIAADVMPPGSGGAGEAGRRGAAAGRFAIDIDLPGFSLGILPCLAEIAAQWSRREWCGGTVLFENGA
jgi:hypothetical protein